MAPEVLAVTMPHIIFKLPFILARFVLPCHCAFAFLLAVDPLAHVLDPFRPEVSSFAINHIVFEPALVNTTVRKFHLPIAFLEPVHERPLVARLVRELFDSTSMG